MLKHGRNLRETLAVSLQERAPRLLLWFLLSPGPKLDFIYVLSAFGSGGRGGGMVNFTVAFKIQRREWLPLP